MKSILKQVIARNRQRESADAAARQQEPDNPGNVEMIFKKVRQFGG